MTTLLRISRSLAAITTISIPALGRTFSFENLRR